ncbi:type I site-specific deoxyribonuclease chain S [Streptococcus pneumoniae]|nr:type I site-specific deoxyribonuclease chain S [Streptococcus pneumoniae]
MTPEQLKASILQRAMEGKLVPQNPNDEPASELLKRIKAEKEKLISEGKIKRDKKETEIFRGDDGKHYGKFADGSTQEIDVPYDIPDTWEWVRIKSIYWNFGQNKPEKSFRYIDTSSIDRKKNIINYKNLQYLSPEQAPSRARKLVSQNSVLFSTVRPYLKNIAVVRELKEYLIASTAFIVLDTLLNETYLKYYLLSDNFINRVNNKSTGTSYPAINDYNFNLLLIALPPLSEQQRIVEAIESALEKVDEYAESYNRLEQLDKEFPDKLKKSILQYAMQGKLVEQDPNDEPASELLKRIKAEKEKLISEGKIKRDKKETEIFRGDDGKHYGKFADGSTQEIDVPYDIPDTWEWVRFSTLVEIVRGGSPRPIKDYLTSEVDGINWIKIGDTEKGEKYINNVKEKIKKSGLNKTRFVKKGTFLLTNSMSFGRPYILNVDGAIHDGWLAISNYENSLNKDYLFYILSSNVVYSQFLSLISGAVVKNLNSDKVASILIPLPPLSEQQRIIEAIESALEKVDEYAESYNRLEQLDKEFPDKLKKSILQYAMQGKLVEQDPNDESVEVLLEKIRAEKQKLFEEGKIKKKDLDISIVSQGDDNSYYEEVPCEIPESWEWVRLNDITSYIQRGKSPKYSNIPIYPVIAQKCNQWSGFSIDLARFIDPETVHSYQKERLLRDGDLMWNSTGLGTLGRLAIYHENKNPYGWAVADSHVTVIRVLSGVINCHFIYNFLSSPIVQSVIEEKASGSTKQKELLTKTIKEYLIPLPPLPEQSRIVDKIEQFFAHIDALI